MTKEELEPKIRECLNTFPFDKVAQAYQAMGHWWSLLNRPPNAEELRECAEGLFARMLEDTGVTLCRTGGLAAYVDHEDNEVGLEYKCGWTVT